MTVSIIVSMSENRVIGKDGRLPWHVPEDVRWFKEKTLGHIVIMGRKTFESIGKPLPGRQNIILSRNREYRVKGALVVHSLEEALKMVHGSYDELFIIGGETLYRQALQYTHRIYFSLIEGRYEGDTVFPEFCEEEFEEVFKEQHTGNPGFTLLILERRKRSG
jgi:dihydrofolate reductase